MYPINLIKNKGEKIESGDGETRLWRLNRLAFPRPTSSHKRLSFSGALGILERMNFGLIMNRGEDTKDYPPAGNLAFYIAWRSTQGTITWRLWWQITLFTAIQGFAGIEMIVNGSPIFMRESCDSLAHESGDDMSYITALICVVFVVLALILEKTYQTLQAVCLLSWPNHYADFTYESRWYQYVFYPSSWSWTGLVVKTTVWISMVFSSLFVMPFTAVSMIWGVLIASNQAC